MFSWNYDALPMLLLRLPFSDTDTGGKIKDSSNSSSCSRDFSILSRSNSKQLIPESESVDGSSIDNFVPRVSNRSWGYEGHLEVSKGREAT